jgi:HJR/Mrr/RecB family endonuclease
MDYAPAMAKPNPSWWKVWDKPPAPPEEPPILDEGERELLIGNLVRGSGRAPAVSESPFSRPLSSDERRDIAQRVVDEAYGDARRLYFRALELHEQGRYEELEELYDSSWVFRSSASIWMHALTRMSAAVLAAEASLLEKNRRAWDRAFTSGMPELDGLSGEAFESRISGLLRSLGYKTEITKATEDAGGDIIAMRRQKTTVVHTKHQAAEVGVEAIQKAIASRQYYEASSALVVTNSTFTPQARELASRAGVDLWDRAALTERLEEAERRRKRRQSRVRRAALPVAAPEPSQSN